MQLAQIISIEINLLKEWQQTQGLSRTLSLGSTGHEVTILQKMLSHDSDIYPEKIITGYYGNLTSRAVRRFQREYGLEANGQVDSPTKDTLNKVFLSFLCPEQSVAYPDFTFRKVNNLSPLPINFTPHHLINISNTVKTIGVTCLRSDVLPSLKKMMDAAKEDGVYLAVTSGYRSPDIQRYLYDYWIDLQGPTALDEIATPGGSEHQLGTAVDLTDGSIGFAGVSESFAKSNGGVWMNKNAHKFGFTLSFPRGKQKITRFKYEPWHWRFVGIEVATRLKKENVAFSEIFP